MAEAPSPKTPEKTFEGVMDDLALAPRKMKHGPCLSSFLHEPLDNVKREFHLSGKRICCYNFDKINREVRLSTVDSDERFTYDTCDDPELFFTVKDWSLFYNYVWHDLKDGCDDPLFIGKWNGITPGMRYRVLGDHINKHADDYIYILCSDSTDGLPERVWPISEEDHLKYYSIKLLFRWKDVPALEDIFGKIDKLFKWCEAFDRYNSIKVKLFHPEWCVPSRRGVHVAPPTFYNH